MNINGYDPYATKSQEYYYDPDAGQKVIDFAHTFVRHVKGELRGQLIRLEDWQQDYLRTLFGFKHKTTHLRRYRESYYSTGRKNGKSFIAGIISLFMLLCDNEGGAEIILSANSRDQASKLYEVVQGIVTQDQRLRERVKILESRRRIVYPQTGSYLVAIPAEAQTEHGGSCHCAIIDELHEAKNRDLYDVLRTSTGARSQPLLLCTTTAGYDRHSICYEVYTHSKKVAENVVDDPHFLPLIHEADEADEADDWTSEKAIKAANPNYGISIKAESLAAEIKRAKEIPSYQNTVLRLHLNLWTEQQTRWLPLSHWQQCQGEIPDLKNVPCYGGLDLSNTRDLSSFSLVWPLDQNIYVKTWSWMPKENARERTKTDRVPYDIWAKEGHVIQTDGNVIDYRSILETIRDLATQYDLRTIAYDRYNACPVVLELQAEGLDLVAFGQGYVSMSAPSKELEKRILEHTIIHDGNPLMTWAVSNVSCATDPAGNIKPVKPEHKDSKRIDPVVATVMALGMVLAQGETVNVYDTRGLIVI